MTDDAQPDEQPIGETVEISGSDGNDGEYALAETITMTVSFDDLVRVVDDLGKKLGDEIEHRRRIERILVYQRYGPDVVTPGQYEADMLALREGMEDAAG